MLDIEFRESKLLDGYIDVINISQLTKLAEVRVSVISPCQKLTIFGGNSATNI